MFKKFWVQTTLTVFWFNKFGVKRKCWVKKEWDHYFGSKILCPKKFGVENILGAKKFWTKNFLGPTRFLGKIIRVQKKFKSKIFWDLRGRIKIENQENLGQC